MAKNKAVFPGSFDPFTLGHHSVVTRALPLFDKVVIAIGKNTQKNGFFTIDERIEMIRGVYADQPKIEVTAYDGLTIDFCKSIGANFMLRGIRTVSDFEYECAISQMNQLMDPQVETVFLLTTSELTPVNSTIVRDILTYGGNVSQFVPEGMDIEGVLKRRNQSK
ncbi:MAG: pantetheine-phosphate adenylyltransferase [Salinivirgaceae bacterium]|nr:pantetheine-phosphate adenylyltransferase [Salinivirgaceae bacterium]